jgi:membrane glycosyltransferase
MSYHASKLLRRLSLAALVVASTVAATLEMVHLLSVNGLTTLECVVAGLFAASFAWVAFSFWTALAGCLATLLGLGAPGGGLQAPDNDERLRSRTAILMPIYHEDPHLAFANLEAVFLSLESTGQSEAFDFYVLSDSQKPARWLAEEVAWAQLCARRAARGRVFYRRRVHNTGKKAGNIADFCRRWGRLYDFVVVLDADSLMAGETLVHMAKLMEANPGAGIIQTPPLVVGSHTPFALLQQYASRVYGRLFATGLAFWHLDDSNYWGHNAIIRTSAFIRYCGLPELPGKAPFGGHILSHDFVEAALMRRAGFAVWLLPDLGGSYEGVPPTVLAFAERDERWCRGNLQHLAIVGARNLRLVSRVHLLMGAMAYGASLLWLLLIIAGLAAALQDRFIVPVYFSPARSLFPDWQVYDVTGGVRLIVVAALLLWLPKLLGLFAYLWRVRERRIRAALSFLIESLWSMLIAPSFMLWHSGFIVRAFLGRETAWEAQRREAGPVAPLQALRRHAWDVLLGVGLALGAYAVLPSLVAWLAPVFVGLALSPLLTLISSLPRLAGWLTRVGLLETPEQRRPPPVVALARELREARPRDPSVSDPLAALVADPALNALHAAVLRGNAERPPRRQDLEASVRRKLASGARDALTSEEERYVLHDAVALTALHLEHRRASALLSAAPE